MNVILNNILRSVRQKKIKEIFIIYMLIDFYRQVRKVKKKKLFIR